MQLESAAGPAPGGTVTLLISDSALEPLRLFQVASAENGSQVETALSRLRSGTLQSRVLELTGFERPVWQYEFDLNHSLYFTWGQGFGCVEVRIVAFGPPLSGSSESWKELMAAAGEANSAVILDTVSPKNQEITAHCPPHPERRLSAGAGLQAYLHPTDNDLLHAIDTLDGHVDDLRGRPYRVLQELRPSGDLPARLSPQQKYMLTRPRPIFLQGVAGSGKTTVLSHFAHQELVRTGSSASALFVAYTDPLGEFVARSLAALCTHDPVDTSQVKIRTWRGLCGSLAEHLGRNPFRWPDDGQFATFARALLCAEDLEADLIPELNELVRAILKGGSEDPEKSLISRESFLSLKDLHIDRYLDRKKVYEIAQQYQVFLATRNLSDDLDAARELFQYKEQLPRFDYVLVDETQDYTLVQLRLLAALAQSSRGLVFAGDMNQVVHPSQFRWERVRSAVFQVWNERPPDPVALEYNYRNPQPVSRMANALMRMRSEKLEENEPESALSNQASTPIPIRIAVSRKDREWIIRQLASQVGSLCVIQKVEEHLEIEGIEFQRTFTPQTVKGLEFKVVCISGFNTLYRDLAARRGRRMTARELFLRFNEVYVSITRTRGQLLLLDDPGDKDGLWDCGEFQDLINTMSAPAEVVSLISARYKLLSRNDWKAVALDFERKKAFAPAGECWERAGVPESAAAAYEKAGQPPKAMAIYKSLGMYPAAARIAEQIGDFAEAARLYAAAGDPRKAAACWAQARNHVESGKAWQVVAEATGAQDAWENAAAQYQKAKRNREAALSQEKSGKWGAAAESWLAAGSLPDAARCFDADGQQKRARECEARHHESNGDFCLAAGQWERAHNVLRACQCWERGNDLESAQRLYRSIGNFHESARLLIALERYEEAAEDFDRLHLPDRAAEQYEKAGRSHTAAERWQSSGNVKQAARCYEIAGDWTAAGDVWAGAGQPAKAALAWERGEQFVLAAKARIESGDHRKAAADFESAGEWVSAAGQWLIVGATENVIRCYRNGGEHALADALVRPAAQPAPGTLAVPESVLPEIRAAMERVRMEEELQAILRLLKAYTKAADEHWTYAIPATEQNRKFVRSVKAARQLDIAILNEECDQILEFLANWNRLRAAHWPEAPDAQEKTIAEWNGIFRARVDEIADAFVTGSNPEMVVEMERSPARFAGLFEITGDHEHAGALWEKAHQYGLSARAYKHCGQREKARAICRAAADPETSAHLFEEAGFHADAALAWARLRQYLQASTELDLLGEVGLATAAKALAFELNGDTDGAQMIWSSIGVRYSEQSLLKAVEAAVVRHEEVRQLPAAGTEGKRARPGIAARLFAAVGHFLAGVRERFSRN